MIVADANLVVALLLGNSGTPQAEAVLRHDSQWCAPALLFSELRNVALGYQRKGLASASSIAEVLRLARNLVTPARVFVPDDDLVMKHAVESGCSAYDCEFAVVAETLALSLVTWDRQVLLAFPGLAVSPEDFATR
jgi:predicted nucleic acid-binding protein